jgi:hypothetical protein
VVKLSEVQIIGQLEFLKSQFVAMSDNEKRGLWENLDVICQQIVLNKTKGDGLNGK